MMPPLVIVIVICILVLTAWIIVHPNPMFENYWILYSWKGPRVNEFAKAFEQNKVTFALGETKETISIVPEGNIESMEFALDEISGSEVRSHTERDNIQLTLNYDLVPYERITFKAFDKGKEIAELIFISGGEITGE